MGLYYIMTVCDTLGTGGLITGVVIVLFWVWVCVKMMKACCSVFKDKRSDILDKILSCIASIIVPFIFIGGVSLSFLICILFLP